MKNNNLYQDDYRSVIKKLRNKRLELGLTQSDVAEKIGKPQSYLSKVENGDRRIDVIELKILAEMYSVEPDYFL